MRENSMKFLDEIFFFQYFLNLKKERIFLEGKKKWEVRKKDSPAAGESSRGAF